ncbi:PfkB family carbohydrate kinase [Anaerovorax odorimutans]|uniref:PfkB family carbohydrate kinase n=1 Tax=Anaerovorax odorimutans TaxID=109327 RepID=A0ABT1RJT0_9FIRM|nr:PfkB family carbohydrate kinase [Anaerovorax odorimutans]MCQ4635433.1 PfkB family carbohydrate kinase [Anaerovorax odorimutans]
MSEITVIGGIKGKIVANAGEQMMAEQENAGVISATYTGTARNIAENLGRLGADTAIVAMAGADFVGKGAKSQLEELGVDTSQLHLIEGENTAMNIAILNIVGDLEFGVGNVDVYDRLGTEQIDEALSMINGSKMVCADGTLSEEVLKYLTEKTEVPLFFDPHSEEDAKKARDFLGAFHTIKPNRGEASAICGMDIFSEEQLMEAGKWFADQGVKRIFITMSGGGVYYKEGMKEGILRPEQVLPFANEEGAGDAFSAAILDGTVKGMDIEAIAAYGMKAAAIALECKCPVNPQMSEGRINE